MLFDSFFDYIKGIYTFAGKVSDDGISFIMAKYCVYWNFIVFINLMFSLAEMVDIPSSSLSLFLSMRDCAVAAN